MTPLLIFTAFLAGLPAAGGAKAEVEPGERALETATFAMG